MEQTQFKTQCQIEKEAKEDALLADYLELISDATRSKTVINNQLMEKYKIYGVSTIYAMVRRAKARAQARAKAQRKS